MSKLQLSDSTRFFDLSLALRLAVAAELIYGPTETLERTVIDCWKSTWFHFLDVEGTQCFVAADDDTITVCFRGTEVDDPRDWIVDLNFDLIDGPFGGRVHEGFYGALSCVWYLLDREVRRLQMERPRKLWVTGHSLGAGLATLAVARWREQDRPVAGLYTFGQPRTGDRTFARHFDFAFRPHAFRIVNHLDVVTRTPPRSLGYYHTGTFVYLNQNGDLAYDISRWRRFLDGWHGAMERILDWGREGIDDHRMSNYCLCIENALGRRASSAPSELSTVPSPDQQAQPALVKPRRRVA